MLPCRNQHLNEPLTCTTAGIAPLTADSAPVPVGADPCCGPDAGSGNAAPCGAW
jgi:hypothetical protein